MLSIDRILWPTDFSDGAEKAFPYAAVLADWHEAELHCLNVNETAPDVPAGVTDQFPLASDTLASYMSAESASSPPLEVEQLRLHQTQVNSSSPAEAILSHAEKDEIDLIVAGTHGRRGMHRMFIRSVTEEVLRRASCAVPTVRADRDLPAAWNVGHIPVPVDVSESAEKAVRYAKELALAYGAHLTLLHAIEERAYPSSYDMESIDFPDEEVIPRVEDSLNEMARDLIGAEHGGRYAGRDRPVSHSGVPGRARHGAHRHAHSWAFRPQATPVGKRGRTRDPASSGAGVRCQIVWRFTPAVGPCKRGLRLTI